MQSKIFERKFRFINTLSMFDVNEQHSAGSEVYRVQNICPLIRACEMC